MQGKVVAITRSKEDSEEFTRLVSGAKAKAISLPTIELVSKGEGMVDEFLDAVKTDDPDYSVFMSSKAVKACITPILRTGNSSSTTFLSRTAGKS